MSKKTNQSINKILNKIIEVVILTSLPLLFGAMKVSAQSCSATGSSVTSPTDYTVTTSSGFLDKGISEERVTELAKTYDVTFHCNGATNVDIKIDQTNINAPSFSTGATDLDLITNSGDRGVTHKVSVTSSSTPSNLATDVEALSDNTSIVDLTVCGGGGCPLDNNGDITISLNSTFLLNSGAEEFVEGTYETTFDITVSPVSSASGATNTTTISSNVDKECSVDTRSISNASPKAYTLTSQSGGNGSIKNNGVAEERAVNLTASDSITFDCNSQTVDYSVDMTTLKAPNFTNATDIDLITSTTQKGVDHRVKLEALEPSSGNTTTLNDDSVLTTGNGIFAGNQATDALGDLQLILTSQFDTVNGAEELGAGDYETAFTVTVTAQ